MPRLTVVCDDFFGAEEGFCTSYGFAALIEHQGKSILFDTGTKPDDLLANLRACGQEVSGLDAVILSHNHYDHTDGLAGILEQHPRVPVYVHRDWDKPHSFKGLVVPRANRVTLEGSRECPELGVGLHITNSYPSDDYGGIYEQACRIETGSGEVLITGCCHPGLDAFLAETDQHRRPLHIIGGFHGFRFTAEDARAIDDRLQEVVCCHCTANYEAFASQFSDRCRRIPVGSTIEIH